MVECGRGYMNIHGFTLVEMLLTLMVAAIAAAFIAWRWPVLDDAPGRARQLAAAVRLTQTLAMGRGGVWTLVLLPPGGYQIRDDQGRAYHAVADLGTVQLETMAATEIRFQQDGTPLAGAGRYILNDALLRYAVTVTPVTGTVAVASP